MCKAEGKSSTSMSPERPTRGNADRQITRDFEKLKDVAKEESKKGYEARALLLAQEVNDSWSNEALPLMLTKERHLKHQDKPPNPYTYSKQGAASKKNENKQGNPESKQAEGN